MRERTSISSVADTGIRTCTRTASDAALAPDVSMADEDEEDEEEIADDLARSLSALKFWFSPRKAPFDAAEYAVEEDRSGIAPHQVPDGNAVFSLDEPRSPPTIAPTPFLPRTGTVDHRIIFRFSQPTASASPRGRRDGWSALNWLGVRRPERTVFYGLSGRRRAAYCLNSCRAL